MLQHFVGHEIQTEKDVFDDTTAVLMDFRCDQSLGMHFIYFLPFSKRQALVESTLFSPKKAPSEFYDNAIKTYLNEIISINNYTILRKEKGIIPLGIFEKRNPSYEGIGGNGGAIRPSSGYAFSFIQKQIDEIITSSKNIKKLKVSSPHTKFELIMDRIFIKVLRINPLIAPQIFTRMAGNLSGDEFAKFLSGEANFKLWLKVIFAMPKIPFMKATFEILKGTNPKW
jgi:lycopene beta-cyclase